MGSISSAVGDERVSRVVGYKLKKGQQAVSGINLPQRIAILGEANTANQAGLDTTAREITSRQEAGELYGFGSPIYQIMRILRPFSSDGVGGIPTIVYPQEVAVGAVASELEITVTGVPTKNGTHVVSINGRTSIDGSTYEFVVTTDDTVDTIAAKISDTINNSLSAPCTADSSLGVVTLVSKWEGLTSNQLNATVLIGDNNLGVTYVTASTVSGAGTPEITDALNQFSNEWNTIVINSYDEARFDVLEAFNGIPDPLIPTGRYAPIVFKPFFALWGSVEQDKDTLAAITDTRKLEVTNVLCPAPNSSGFTFEASANGAFLASIIYQNNPNLDLNAKSYPDMPVPLDSNIGDMADYNNRDFLVKKGCSTIDLVAGKYSVQDFVTTYHPDGEVPPQFLFARNLMIDFNVRYGYFLLEQIFVVDKSIAENDQPITAEGVIKPKEWKQKLISYAGDLAVRNLITDVTFMEESIEVGTGESNPDRFETSFRYKRSPIARISSTTAEANFTFSLTS